MRAPLAERLRPQSLDAFVGQPHLVGEEGILRRIIQSGQIPSMIFWGPPGTGKTTLANIISQVTDRPYFALSAVESGVKQIREVLDKARRSDFFDTPSPILFIDEIHRFNKSQQDALLKAVEKGTVVLIGATTENPSFEVNNALLSRCQVFVLQEHTEEDLKQMVDNAWQVESGFRQKNLSLVEYDALLRFAGGDARRLYNVLELVLTFSQEGDKIDNEAVTQIIQKNLTAYDKSGDQHYDIISAFIKSVRGSDPNAAVYWLARMIEGGEDPVFICRRMIILAAEDIGLANPNALLMAQSCMASVRVIGMPEGRIVMSETAIYLALAAKSNTAYKAINAAQAHIRNHGTEPVPLSLRNAPTSLMKKLDYGKDYAYAHDFEDSFTQLDFLPEGVKGTRFYEPGDNPRELQYKKWLSKAWQDQYGYRENE